MREQLRILARVAEIDEEASTLDTQLEEIPKKLSSFRSDLERLNMLLEGERKELLDAEALLRSQESELAATQDALGKAKAKAVKARSGKEAEAGEREIEGFRRSVREREDELLKLQEAIEQVRGKVEQHSRELEEAAALFAEDEKEDQARLESIQSERAIIGQKREAAAAELPRDILSRYERIRARRGSGTAWVEEGSCQACRISLSAKLFMELQRGEELHQCPNCNRVLIYRPLVL